MTKFVITAGPTREFIDPVRYISNCSSGKMGYALANAVAETGAEVVLISGPTCLSVETQHFASQKSGADPKKMNKTQHETQDVASLQVINVISAQQMHDAVMQNIVDCDVFIGVAAVADYRPVKFAKQKIKKTADKITLELERNPDILADVAKLKNRPFVVGFAAETENLIENATKKLQQKNLDMIVANRIETQHETQDLASLQGMDSDFNKIFILRPNERMIESPLALKTVLAKQIIDVIESTIHHLPNSKDCF